MSLKVITITNNLEATQPLINSLDKNRWDFMVLVRDWHGFGTKLIETYKYLKSAPKVTEFVFCDAFDVVALGTPEEFKEKIGNVDFLVSAERGCWPVGEWELLYPNKYSHGYNYVNSGLYYAKSKVFIDLMEFDMPEYSTDDQMWLSKHYLDAGIIIELDNDCNVFQSYSFIKEDDFRYNRPRLSNYNTGTLPCWVHGNGRTDMTKIYELIK